MKIYRLKIVLQGTDPQVWRRIEVPANLSFNDLHYAIQYAMGWEEDHLFEFELGNTRIYDFGPDVDMGQKPGERDVFDTFLDEFLHLEKFTFSYLYDFGDNWMHKITVEKIKEEGDHTQYPRFVDGAMDCPPEDCGGLHAYIQLKKSMEDKHHPARQENLDWIGEWDPYYLDKEEIEQQLEGLREFLYENDEGDDWDDFDNLRSFESVEHINSPTEMLRDEIKGAEISMHLENLLQNTESLEYQTLQRLMDSGMNEREAKRQIASTLAIEHYYEFKLGIVFMWNRYKSNLQNLPSEPMEIANKEQAAFVIDNRMVGIPYAAVDFLLNDSSGSNRNFIFGKLNTAPENPQAIVEPEYWYALVAERHLCPKLGNIVIRLAKNDRQYSIFLLEQIKMLNARVAELYPELIVEKTLDAIEECLSEDQVLPYNRLFLLDALFYCDQEKYRDRLIAIVENAHEEDKWRFAMLFADIQFKESLPVLREIYNSLESEGKVDFIYGYEDIAKSIDLLEGNKDMLVEPFFKKFSNDWKERIFEAEFYEKDEAFDDWGMPDADYYAEPPKLKRGYFRGVPLVKEKKPGRNEPCHCGSGKKYKKCCLPKDEALEKQLY